MTFTLRKNGPYLDVKVQVDNTVISVGLLNSHECNVLAATLRLTADDLERCPAPQPAMAQQKEGVK